MATRKYLALTIGIMILLAGSITLWGQTATQPRQTVNPEVKIVRDAKVVTVTAPDSAQGQISTFSFVSSEMGFESRVVKGVPFSADTVTEFTQILGNGQRIYRKNTASMYRDGEGRTRHEQTIDAIGPYASSGPAKQTIIIFDSVAGVSYVLNPTEHTASKTTISNGGWAMPAGTTGVKVLTSTGGDLQIADGVKVAGAVGGGGGAAAGAVTMRTQISTQTNSRTEPLGTQMIEGVAAEGTRTIETIPAGAIGNDTPIEIVSERWYSAELDMVVKTVHNDPMSGENVYQLKNITRGEPSPDLFQVPPDYTVKEANIKIQVIKKEDK